MALWGPQKACISDPRGTSAPKVDSLGLSACNHIWYVGVSPPRPVKSTILAFLGVSGPGQGHEISLSPPDPPETSKSQFLGGETDQSVVSEKVAQRKRGSDEPKKTRNLSGGAKLWPKRRYLPAPGPGTPEKGFLVRTAPTGHQRAKNKKNICVHLNFVNCPNLGHTASSCSKCIKRSDRVCVSCPSLLPVWE